MSAARRLLLDSLAWLCVLVGVLAFSGAPAFAAAPEAPGLEAVSRKATPSEEVRLRGVLYPKAPGEPGSYEILYKQSTSECQGASKTTAGVATGNQGEEVSQALGGLEAGKRYTACLSVTSTGGTSLSAPVTVIAPIAPEAPSGLKAEPVGAVTATLRGTFNSLAERKAEPGSYEFVYRQSATECEGEGQVSTPPANTAGAQSEAVSAPITELLPHTAYTFCLRQANEVEEVATSAPVTFTTLAAAPKIEESGATGVTAESATAVAKINPQGAETSYTFEYAPAGNAFVPVPGPEGKGALSEGTSGISVSAHVQGLSAHSAYRFRVTATNSVEAVTGREVSFTTQVSGGSSALPDGRQWEMVSPPQIEGALLLPIRLGIIQAAADGDAFAGESFFEPIEGKAAGAYGLWLADFFGRGPDGWESDTLTPPHSGPGLVPLSGQEYYFYSRDLSKAILQPFGPLTQLAPGVSQSTAYIRTDYLNDNRGELCHTGCYLPLVNDGNVPPGTQYGEEETEPCNTRSNCGPSVWDVTPDLSHVLISSPAALTTGSKGGLYEWAAGKLTFVGEGGPASAGSLFRHAISDDGSRIFMNGTYEGMSGLLMRDMVTGETVQIGPGGFLDASSDGSRIFLSNNGELLEYDLNAAPGSHLTDLSVDPNPGEGAGVSALLGASEDGSYVYFAATGVLAPGAIAATCSGGQPCMNLYVHHDGRTKFIAGLGNEDGPSYSGRAGMTSRVSPNGQWLAFMSNRDLTGYDTTDAISGMPDEEVYAYSAAADRLVCASCNPTGARPVGVEYADKFGLVQGLQNFENSTWIASNIPPWMTFTGSYSNYQSRYLSDEGRLFFDSHDALVPQDVNGNQDVYQYEPPGAGNCSVSQATFNTASDGCVSLISSGESSEESAFLDASETGGDVFFLTTAKLVPQDVNNSLAIYDARECGSDRSRCLTLGPVAPPPCSSADACKGAPSPQPAIFGSPASSTFSGVGDVAPSTTVTSTVAPKRLTMAQRLEHALKACHRRRGKPRRECERQAHARYGAKHSRTAKTTRGTK
jgi:hypothetical protein